MPEVRRLTAARVRASRRGAPEVHLLDEAPGAIHLGWVEGSAVLGVLSGLPEAAVGEAGPSLQAYGPFGEGGEALVEALAAEAGPGRWLWSEAPLPTFQQRPSGPWRRWTGDPTDGASYAASSVLVVPGSVENIRLRPGMYLGGTDPSAVLAMVLELVANSLDQHLAGHAHQLGVFTDGESWTVSDDGPGIEPERLAQVFSQLHHGETADGHRPHVHVSMHGVGVAVVNALSSTLVVTVDRGGRRWALDFRQGHPTGPIADRGPTDRRGTQITFTPDPAIFDEARVDERALRDVLVGLAWLNLGLEITLRDEVIRRPRGLVGLAEELAAVVPTRTLHARGVRSGVEVEVAVAWAPGLEAILQGWVNQSPCRGSHLAGLAAGLEGTDPSRVALVSVMAQRPQFAGRTREVVQATAIAAAVEEIVRDALNGA